MKSAGWHEKRFEQRDGAVQVDCVECGRPMWLPPSKAQMYRRCGSECIAASQLASRESRSRECETCGGLFTPRTTQISGDSNDMWRDLRDNAPDEFADAVLIDRAIRDSGSARGIRGQQFMHRSCVPLDVADLDRGQPGDLFGNECEGMCGV